MPSKALGFPTLETTTHPSKQNVPLLASLADSCCKAIRQISLLADASDEALARLMSRSRWRVYVAGEVVLDAGDMTNDVFFITEGAVRVAHRTAFGYELILNDLRMGDFFGELAAIDGSPRSANVTALQQTRLCVVPAPAFIELILSCPPVTRSLLRLLTARLRGMDERLIGLGAFSVRQRLIVELLRLSRDRGRGERVLSPPPSQQELAARIGTRRETVSRELTKMSRDGLLTTGRRAVVLHSPDRLRAEIEMREAGTFRAFHKMGRAERELCGLEDISAARKLAVMTHAI